MRLTIGTIVGIAFSIIGFIMVFTFAYNQINVSKESEIKNVQVIKVGKDIKISWTTTDITDGLIKYSNGTKKSDVKSYDLETIHGLVIQNISGTVKYNITSCNMNKKCVSAQGVI